MKISYVLPVWNAEHILNITLRSLVNQKHEDKEIIIINDGSNDHSIEIIKHYLKSDTGLITYIENPTREGAAICRNKGNEIASGDIIAVCDCDSYMRNRGDILEEFFKNDEFDAFYSSVKCVDSFDPSREWIQEAFEWDFNSKCPISHPTMAFRSDIAKKYKYHEKSIETDLFEFMLIDMHRDGVKFSGAQDVTCVKLEGDTERKAKEAKELKLLTYKEYGIEI